MRPPRVDRESGMSLAGAGLLCICCCVCVGLVAALVLASASVVETGSCCLALIDGASLCIEHTNASACNASAAATLGPASTFTPYATCAASPACPGASANQSNQAACCQLPGPACTDDFSINSTCTKLGGNVSGIGSVCSSSSGVCSAPV